MRWLKFNQWGGFDMLVEKTQIMDQKAMLRAITRISFEIIEHNKGASNLYIIGIMTRGAEAGTAG